MHKVILGLTATMILSGCNQRTDPNWIYNCDKYSNYDAREYDLCVKGKSKQIVDPNDLSMSRPDEREIGK